MSSTNKDTSIMSMWMYEKKVDICASTFVCSRVWIRNQNQKPNLENTYCAILLVIMVMVVGSV